jgi:hypothetical protein
MYNNYPLTRRLPRIRDWAEAKKFFDTVETSKRNPRWTEWRKPLDRHTYYNYSIRKNNINDDGECYELWHYNTPLITFCPPDSDGTEVTYVGFYNSPSTKNFMEAFGFYKVTNFQAVAHVGAPITNAYVPLTKSSGIPSDPKAAKLTFILVDGERTLDMSRSHHTPVLRFKTSPERKKARRDFARNIRKALTNTRLLMTFTDWATYFDALSGGDPHVTYVCAHSWAYDRNYIGLLLAMQETGEIVDGYNVSVNDLLEDWRNAVAYYAFNNSYSPKEIVESEVDHDEEIDRLCKQLRIANNKWEEIMQIRDNARRAKYAARRRNPRYIELCINKALDVFIQSVLDQWDDAPSLDMLRKLDAYEELTQFVEANFKYL